MGNCLILSFFCDGRGVSINLRDQNAAAHQTTWILGSLTPRADRRAKLSSRSAMPCALSFARGPHRADSGTGIERRSHVRAERSRAIGINLRAEGAIKHRAHAYRRPNASISGTGTMSRPVPWSTMT